MPAPEQGNFLFEARNQSDHPPPRVHNSRATLARLSLISCLVASPGLLSSCAELNPPACRIEVIRNDKKPPDAPDLAYGVRLKYTNIDPEDVEDPRILITNVQGKAWQEGEEQPKDGFAASEKYFNPEQVHRAAQETVVAKARIIYDGNELRCANLRF